VGADLGGGEAHEGSGWAEFAEYVAKAFDAEVFVQGGDLAYDSDVVHCVAGVVHHVVDVVA
jgi:hypothetical protein